MKNNFKALKASLIIGIFIVSMFAVLVPANPVKGGLLVNFSSIVNLNWEDSDSESLSQPIQPKQDLRPYNLMITYKVNAGGFLSGETRLKWFLAGRTVPIKLELVDYPEWAIVQLATDTVIATVPDTIGIDVPFKVQIVLSLDETAPAFESGVIYIKATVPKVGPIEGMSKTFSLSFMPAYLPLVKIDPIKNYDTIGPMDTAEFPIDVTNLGNARTKVFFEIDYDSLPSGWTAIINDNIILETGANPTGKVYLNVKPPKSFGYHDDRANIRIKVIPAYADIPTNRGEPEYITVAVESRGVSLIGIEVILPIIILIILVIVGIYMLYKKRLIK